MKYLNARGQPAADPDPTHPVAPIDPLDFERCQARTGSHPGRRNPHGRVRLPNPNDPTAPQRYAAARSLPPLPQCPNKPTMVMVENKVRDGHGKIHSMTLCDDCYKILLNTQGPDYAHATPLE